MLKSLEKEFKSFCEDQDLEVNINQINVIKKLEQYYQINFKSFFSKLFSKKLSQKGFYLYGDVGVGKTMILNFFFDQLDQKKLRKHFNEFMLNFHNFAHERKEKNEENIINQFVKDLKSKASLIFFDEFQVTNIVDAMILGKLFKKIFEKKIRVIFSSNIKIKDLYKDGLQRDQFIPFIQVLENNSDEKELLIEEDYRSNNKNKLERFLSPKDQSINFRFNKYFRQVTKNKKKTLKILEVKGRNLELKNFYERIIKFDFDELCNRNLGSEDYISIANNCDFMFIENLPDFNEDNSDQQQRFITLIDIIYEKKIPLMITSGVNLNTINSSKNLTEPFKRTISRLYELTSIDYN